jgi:hypothetical protein
MRYSGHALIRMAERGISPSDVERTIAEPLRGRYEPKLRDRREWYGYTADGRFITVVTNRAVTIVISVFEQ